MSPAGGGHGNGNGGGGYYSSNRRGSGVYDGYNGGGGGGVGIAVEMTGGSRANSSLAKRGDRETDTPSPPLSPRKPWQ
ncbi:hypothetical protein FRC20_000200 [Serendipita sp. 405]|nr:hypothetical protein FRC20_000200 [Serendipita sp. 405]